MSSLMRPEQNKQEPNYQSYRVLLMDQVAENKLTFTEEQQKDMFAMPGVVQGQSVQIVKDEIKKQDRLMVHMLTRNGYDYHSKTLYYRIKDSAYELATEVNMKNSEYHGMRVEYDKDGDFSKMDMFRDGALVKSFSAEISDMVVGDWIKGLVGIKRRDADTRNTDRLQKLKRKHADLKL